jgi:hypothetical protein
MEKDTLMDVGREFADAKLGNAARTRRLSQIANRIAAQPEANLPQQMLDPAGLEGAYRFFENDSVAPQAVLDAHIGQTVGRMVKHPKVLVLHDTTSFKFAGKKPREGLGFLNGEKQQGFYAHSSIAVAGDGEPLGTVHTYAWSRPELPEAVPEGKSRRRTSQYDPDRESLRWGEAALACAEQTGGKTELIHIMDREGDCLELFTLLLEHDQGFLIRLAHNRRLSGGRSAETIRLFERLSAAPVIFEREVVLSQRGPRRSEKEEKKFPARERRNAILAVRAQTLEIFAANGASANVPESITLNFVDVEEIDPPNGCEPVRWRLVTTEPIETPEQIAAVVDIYRMRWLIEEFFKAIKTGCRYQDRQLKTANALLIDLAIESAIASRLLRMRWLSRANPDAPASRVLTPSELGALTELCAADGQPLPATPTVKDALYAVARIGGHIGYRGPPGWLVLRRGFADLSVAERLWIRMNRIRNPIDD